MARVNQVNQLRLLNQFILTEVELWNSAKLCVAKTPTAMLSRWIEFKNDVMDWRVLLINLLECLWI